MPIDDIEFEIDLSQAGQAIRINGRGTEEWVKFLTVDSVTKGSGACAVLLEDTSGALNSLFEQYDPITIQIDGTMVFNGRLTNIEPLESRGVIQTEGKNYIDDLQGEYIIESYGISQTASNSPSAGSNVVINIADTTGYEVGDEIRVEDIGEKELIADSATLLFGAIEAGDVDDTASVNATYLQIGERAGDGAGVQFDFSLGSGGVGRHIDMTGRYQGGSVASGHYVEVFAWDWTTGMFDVVSDGNNRIEHNTSDTTYIFELRDEHTDTDGSVRIKFQHVTTTWNNAHDIYIDYVAIERNPTAELAEITAVVTDTSITVATLNTSYTTPIVTVGQLGSVIVDDLVSKKAPALTRNGIQTSNQKFIKDFKGITANDAVLEIADAEDFEYGHDITLDFFYQPRLFEDSGLTLILGTDDIVDFDFPRPGYTVVNRVDVYGATIGGVQIGARTENIESQEFYGDGTNNLIKGKTIINENKKTEDECRALGQAILNEFSFVIQRSNIIALGYETLKAGQLITLSGFTSAPNGLYLVLEITREYPPGLTTLTMAQFFVETEDFIVDLIRRMREREKEALDSTITLTKFLNFYDTLTSADTLIIEKEAINHTWIAGHPTNGKVGEGFLGVDGQQITVGSNTTITQLIP